MLTLFAIPKPFRGQIATIQRDAIASWTRLSPRPPIVLLGDEEGTAEAARQFDASHVPGVARNEFGTPLVDDIFRKAEACASTPLLGYVNADIILTDDFSAALERTAAVHTKFMMVGRRWDLDCSEAFDFSAANWAANLRARAVSADVQRPATFIDYFIFSRGLCDPLLPMAIGRTTWDNYLLWRARSHGADLVDASQVVVAIHQNHDYSHHSQGAAGVWKGPEAKRNRAMAGPWWHLYTIEDATHILTPEGERTSRRHAWLVVKRLWSHPLTVFQLPWLAVKRLVRA